MRSKRTRQMFQSIRAKLHRLNISLLLPRKKMRKCEAKILELNVKQKCWSWMWNEICFLANRRKWKGIQIFGGNFIWNNFFAKKSKRNRFNLVCANKYVRKFSRLEQEKSERKREREKESITFWNIWCVKCERGTHVVWAGINQKMIKRKGKSNKSSQ